MMKTAKLTKLLIGILCIIFGLSPGAWAGGGPAGDECCVKVDKNLGSTTPMKATAAVYYDATSNIVDATIRLERKGMQRFYRVRITADISAASDIDIFCLLFNPCSWGPLNQDNRDAVIAVVNEILDDFFGLQPDPVTGEPVAELLITEKSISDTDPNPEVIGARQIPDTDDRSMSVAEIAVYVSEF
jgi:hypothetical protein